MIPATTEELAELDRRLRPGAPPSFSLALDAVEVHADTIAGRYSTEGLGRYCRTGLPMLLRRLLGVESELATLRAKVAGHIAAYDQGDDPTGLELLEDLKRADVTAAAAVLEGQAHAATF